LRCATTSMEHAHPSPAPACGREAGAHPHPSPPPLGAGAHPHPSPPPLGAGECLFPPAGFPSSSPPPSGYALPITRILHCQRAGAGQGRDDGRAPQPGAGSARHRRAWCRYHIARVPERVGGVMTGVLPSRELGARASGAHGAGTTPSRASHTCARRLECGSHAAAPAVLTIRRVSHRSPAWSRQS
jgi:hypothetical protein